MKSCHKNNLPEKGLDIESLMEALLYRDEFLSIASHELRTPLTAMKLQIQLLKRNAKSDASVYSKERVDRVIDQFDGQITRLMKLIDDMLDVSSIRSGGLNMIKETFNLSELIIQTATGYHTQQIDLCVEEGITYYGDKDRIAQVLSKLLDNAFKFGKGLPIEVSLFKKNSKITLSVKDSGEGILEEDQRRVFHRFQRGVAASEVSGLGLGLYMAREIVEAHNGTILLKSVTGKGSLFSIILKSQILS